MVESIALLEHIGPEEVHLKRSLSMASPEDFRSARTPLKSIFCSRAHLMVLQKEWITCILLEECPWNDHHKTWSVSFERTSHSRPFGTKDHQATVQLHWLCKKFKKVKIWIKENSEVRLVIRERLLLEVIRKEPGSPGLVLSSRLDLGEWAEKFFAPKF